MLQSRSPRVQIEALLRRAGAEDDWCSSVRREGRAAPSPSWAAGSLWRQVRAAWASTGGQTLSVLEVGAGGGELAIGLARRARRAQLPCRIEACDREAQAVVAARFAAQEAEVNVEFFHHDVADGIIPLGYDLIVCWLGRQSNDPERLARLLGHLHEAAGRTAIVFAHELSDFSADDLANLAERAGMDHVRIARRFPGRLLLTSRRK